MRRIRARDIQFIRGNALSLIQNLQSLFVVSSGVSKDIGKHDDVFHLAQLGKFLVHECACANILKTDRIEHACSRFVQARGRIARHRLLRESLYDKSAKLIEVYYVFEFDAITESATGGDNWIFKIDTGEAHTKVAHRAPPPEATKAAGFISCCGFDGLWPGAGETSARRGGASASVNTRPTECVGALMPSKEASVTARSTGSAGAR